MWWIVAVVAAVVLIATYVTWIAARLDRLHARAAAANAALDAQLVRRAAAAAELADSLGRGDLRRFARAALEAVPEERELAENDLTRELRRVPLADEAGGVVEASRRVALNRQVHNDSVRDALAVRRRPLVRLLRLARRHPAPRYFDVDDPRLEPAVPAA
jgi:Tfp pilus assembly protein PilO